MSMAYYVLTRVRSSSWGASGSQSPWWPGHQRWQTGRARGCLEGKIRFCHPLESIVSHPTCLYIQMFQAEGTFEMLLSNQFLNIMFLNILTDVRPLVHLVDPMSCMSGERELGRKLAIRIRDTGLHRGGRADMDSYRLCQCHFLLRQKNTLTRRKCP